MEKKTYIHRKVGIVIIEAFDRFFASWCSFRIYYSYNSKSSGIRRVRNKIISNYLLVIILIARFKLRVKISTHK